MNQVMNYASEIFETEELLLNKERNASHAKVRNKVRLVRLLKQGLSLQKATEQIGISYRQAQRYVTTYRLHGIGELLKVNYKSNASKLNANDIDALRKHIKRVISKENAVALTLTQLQAYIADTFQQSYTLGGISALLKRHKITY